MMTKRNHRIALAIVLGATLAIGPAWPGERMLLPAYTSDSAAEPELVTVPGLVTPHGEAFVSLDTVIIGCTAGAAAGALAVTLPAVTIASTGVGVPATAAAMVATAGLGCVVGVVSGLAAIGTALGVTWVSERQ